jgi:hypothetical protein
MFVLFWATLLKGTKQLKTAVPSICPQSRKKPTDWNLWYCTQLLCCLAMVLMVLSVCGLETRKWADRYWSEVDLPW